MTNMAPNSRQACIARPRAVRSILSLSSRIRTIRIRQNPFRILRALVVQQKTIQERELPGHSKLDCAALFREVARILMRHSVSNYIFVPKEEV